MAYTPKLSKEEWAKARSTWESDDREGYAWLIEKLDLPVSGPAIRKVVIREGWVKNKSKKTSMTSKKNSRKTYHQKQGFQGF